MLGKKAFLKVDMFNHLTDLNFNHDVPCTVIGISYGGLLLCKFPFQHESMHNGTKFAQKLYCGDYSEDNDCLWVWESELR